MIKGFKKLKAVFGGHSGHPLADAEGQRQALADLPLSAPLKTLQEVIVWLESLAATEEVPVDRRFDIVRQFEAVMQPLWRHLLALYFQNLSLHRVEVETLWTSAHRFWSLAADAYELCGQQLARQTDREMQAGVATHALGALRMQFKWRCFCYGPIPGDTWSRMGRILLAAESLGLDVQQVDQTTARDKRSVRAEYVMAVASQVAAMDCLHPVEMEIAERLITYCQPAFVFGPDAERESVYWVDPATDLPPQRLARLPATLCETQRFFRPAGASEMLLTLTQQLGQGVLPDGLNLGGEYAPRVLQGVIRHLMGHLAAVPPQRRHIRHAVANQMNVRLGLEPVSAIFSSAGLSPAPAERWLVENVSQGGFGARLQRVDGNTISVGTLLAVQPEGGANWLVGVVRRCQRRPNGEVDVGIETLARRAETMHFVPMARAAGRNMGMVQGLVLREGADPAEWRVVLPHATYDPRDALAYVDADGRLQRLAPVGLIGRGSDYELAAYRPQGL